MGATKRKFGASCFEGIGWGRKRRVWGGGEVPNRFALVLVLVGRSCDDGASSKNVQIIIKGSKCKRYLISTDAKLRLKTKGVNL